MPAQDPSRHRAAQVARRRRLRRRVAALAVTLFVASWVAIGAHTAASSKRATVSTVSSTAQAATSAGATTTSAATSTAVAPTAVTTHQS